MMFVIKFAFIVCILTWACRAQRYRTERVADGEDNFVIIPRSDPCSSYGATVATIDPTRCICNKSTSSSFGFFDNRFRCFENSKIRTRAGCNTGFQMGSASYTSEIQTLHLNATKQYGFIGVLFPDSPCNHVRTQYQACNGSWIPIVNFLSEIRVKHYRLTVQVTSPTSVFTGKLIKLQLRCARNKTMFEDCLLFKLEGTQECVTPLQPTQVYSVNSSTAVKQNRSSAAAAKATTMPVTTTTVEETVSSDSSSLQPVETEGTDPYDQEESAVSMPTILGSLLALLLIISAALGSVLVIRSRKQRGKHSFNQPKFDPHKGAILSAEKLQGNLNKSFVPDGSHLYPVPIYEEILEISSTSSQNEKDKNSNAASNCDKDGYISPDEPIQKEDPPLQNLHCKLNTSTSLVGRRATFPSSCGLQLDKDAIGAYDNLKDILAELGRPTGAIYEELEGPDPNSDAQKHRPKSHLDTPGTSTSIYQVLEGPQPDDTYQPLGKKISIYQTLERTRKHISLSTYDDEQYDVDEVAL